MTNYTPEMVLNRSFEWFQMMIRALLKMEVEQIKMISMAMRITPEQFKDLDKQIEFMENEEIPIGKQKLDIRPYENIPGIKVKRIKRNK